MREPHVDDLYWRCTGCDQCFDLLASIPYSSECNHTCDMLSTPNASKLIKASQPIIIDPPLTKSYTWTCKQCSKWYPETEPGVEPKDQCDHPKQRVPHYDKEELKRRGLKG